MRVACIFLFSYWKQNLISMAVFAICPEVENTNPVVLFQRIPVCPELAWWGHKSPWSLKSQTRI